MKTVLITGAKGFIGRNLVTHLETMENISLLKYDLENTLQELEHFIEKADFVFHLAGINRPPDISEFDSGNRGFTELLFNILKKRGGKAPVLISSSSQAALDNPYGVSKKGAEQIALDYAGKTGVPVYIYRLPNVFGKWCRPNYNSVIATFCYNIANGYPIQINDPATELTLVYIDDLVNEFVNALKGSATEGYCYVEKTYKATLKQLADMIYSFAESRKTLVVPDFADEFARILYATYLSYLPDNGFGYKLEMKCDNRGWLAEFIKSSSFGQIFISRTKPGITRGNHWHHTKVEKFLVIDGEAVIKFRQIETENEIEYKVSGRELKVVDIPVGYTHAISNIGKTDVITLFWANEIFNSEKPDTYFLEV